MAVEILVIALDTHKELRELCLGTSLRLLHCVGFGFQVKGSKGAVSKGHKSQHSFTRLNFASTVGFSTLDLEGMRLIDCVFCGIR